MRVDKWMAEARADQRVSRIARVAVRVRLQVVAHYLRLAALKADKNPEYVHQLRVSTRRAQSVLAVFADAFPKHRRRWFQKYLKQLRELASAARDLDVLIDRLAKPWHDDPDSPLATILADLRSQRELAQQPLVRAWKQMKRGDFSRRLKALVARTAWRGDLPEPELQDHARSTLAPLVEGFFAASEADLDDHRNLHQMRIAGKRVRYAFELLSKGLDERLRDDVYPLFAQIQEELGELNDHVVAEALFESWLVQTGDPTTAREVARLTSAERLASRESSERFHRWWTPESARRLRRLFNRLLDRPPSVPKVKKLSAC